LMHLSLGSKFIGSRERYVQQGRSIVLIGDAGHPEGASRRSDEFQPYPISCIRSRCGEPRPCCRGTINCPMSRKRLCDVRVKPDRRIAAKQRSRPSRIRAGNKIHLLRDTKPQSAVHGSESSSTSCELSAPRTVRTRRRLREIGVEAKMSAAFLYRAPEVSSITKC